MPLPSFSGQTDNGLPKANIPDLCAALIELLTPDGIQASTWDLFQGAIFGRDSEQVALDLVPWMRSVAERVIFSLVRLQGTKDNPVSEEEPGRIHHEYRHLYVGGRKVGPRQQELLNKLSQDWGGTESEMTYYGTVDATPQLVRLIAAYCRLYGNEILDAEFIHRDGSTLTIGKSLISAMSWIENSLKASPLGLVEFQRKNPKGIMWQVMRDGRLSYLHTDGSLANFQSPIASLEVQSLAYDALLYSSELFVESNPESAARWRSIASTLKETVLKKFWIEKQSCFAMAIDRSPKDGSPRLVTSSTSVPAELLITRLFDTLAESEKEKYIGAIVRTMYSDDFLTDVGIRSRALRHRKLLPLWDYQGSNVSWVVTTNIFSQGLRRQGFRELADDMDNRMINGANIARQYLEYYFVDDDGHVHYHHVDDIKEPYPEDISDNHSTIIGTNRPETTQAWTVSALLAASLRKVRDASAFSTFEPSYWQKRIEADILAANPQVSLLDSEEEVKKAYPNLHSYYVDRSKGQDLEEEFLKEHGIL